MPFHNKEGELLEGNDVAAFQAHSDKKKNGNTKTGNTNMEELVENMWHQCEKLVE